MRGNEDRIVKGNEVRNIEIEELKEEREVG